MRMRKGVDETFRLVASSPFNRVVAPPRHGRWLPFNKPYGAGLPSSGCLLFSPSFSMMMTTRGMQYTAGTRQVQSSRQSNHEIGKMYLCGVTATTRSSASIVIFRAFISFLFLSKKKQCPPRLLIQGSHSWSYLSPIATTLLDNHVLLQVRASSCAPSTCHITYQAFVCSQPSAICSPSLLFGGVGVTAQSHSLVFGVSDKIALCDTLLAIWGFRYKHPL